MNRKLTTQQQHLVIQLAYTTWQEVGSDLMSAMEEAGERVTKAVIYETIGDADRMEDRAETAEEKAALQAFRHKPWNAQLRILRKANLI